eukprot:TRINITY_DN10271_c0_g1_i14.p6 TRINITY_DN10271_c0_g1~~TRINITY_DN10271_c0_g1_i14.p6  ORF type:complete len:155 (-),score=2.61 TRINITY_DN10271_c0_g1_i14:1811-2275(-)
MYALERYGALMYLSVGANGWTYAYTLQRHYVYMLMFGYQTVYYFVTNLLNSVFILLFAIHKFRLGEQREPSRQLPLLPTFSRIFEKKCWFLLFLCNCQISNVLKSKKQMFLQMGGRGTISLTKFVKIFGVFLILQTSVAPLRISEVTTVQDIIF